MCSTPYDSATTGECSLRFNNRGISIGISQFLLTLAVGAIMLYLISQVSENVLPGAREATNNETANQGTAWIQQGVDLLPIVILLIAFLSLIVLAVYQRELR